MSHLLLFFKGAYKIGCFHGFTWGSDKNSELWGWAYISEGKLIRDVDDNASDIVLHDSSNVLGGGSSSMSVVEGVHLIGQEAKGSTRRYFEVVRESVNLALYAQVVVEGIAVEIAELRSVSL